MTTWAPISSSVDWHTFYHCFINELCPFWNVQFKSSEMHFVMKMTVPYQELSRIMSVWKWTSCCTVLGYDFDKSNKELSQDASYCDSWRQSCSHISRAYCKRINHSHTYLGVCTWLPSLSFYYFHPWYEWRCLIAQLCWIHWIAHTGNGISSLMSHSLTLLQFKQSSGVIQEQVTPKIMPFFLGLPRTSIGTCAL